MSFCSVFIEISSAELAVHNINMMLLTHHFHLIWIRNIILIFPHSDVSSQGNRLSFPFRNVLSFFSLIYFLFSNLSPFYKFFLLFTYHSLILSIKLFSFFFSKSLTNSFMLLYPTLMELSTTLSTSFKLLWINFILIYLKILLVFYLINTLLL